jgi:hypothetical protein
MTEPTKEYWQAKAQLCEKVAMDQLLNADSAGAMRNLERMVYALSRVGITNKREDMCVDCGRLLAECEQDEADCSQQENEREGKDNE